MQRLFLLIGLSGFMYSLQAQNQKPWEHKQVQFFVGFTAAKLMAGTELLSAQDLRNQGLSYGQKFGNQPKNVGSYPKITGGNFGIKYFAPNKLIKRLMTGTYFRGVMTGVNPDVGDQEGYYFNPISLGITAKYYPIAAINLSIVAEAGMGGIMTKNRYIDDTGNQKYHHQYGIGSSTAVGLAYFIRLKNEFGVEFLTQYQSLNVNVEVDNIGSDNWRTSLWNTSLILSF
jgi:hypothetical protein